MKRNYRKRINRSLIYKPRTHYKLHDKSRILFVWLFESFFLTSSHPKSLLIVTFSQRDCQLIARDLGQNYTAITKEERQRIWFLLNKIYGIIKSRYSDTYEQMDLVREDPDFQLFEQNKNQFMHGVICIYPGMPKILRDFYDDLYRRGVIRLIVVTDEIAVNSPYRGQYILLSSIRKYDGKNYRYLTNYEFRRCLCFELRGLPPDPEKQLRSVTLILDWTISVEAFKDIVIPKPSELMSAYVPTLMTVKQRKTNNMLTSLLKKTFYNIYRMDKIETIQKDKPLLEHEIEAAANEPDIEIVKRYFALKLELEEKEKSLDAARYKYSLIKNHIKNVGRLVRIVNGDRDFGWGAILRYVAPNENVKDPLLYVALRVTRDCVDKLSDFNLVAPPHPDEEACNIDNGDGRTKTSVGICLVPVSCVIAVSDLRVKLPRVIRDPDSQRILQITINGINASTSRISKLKVSGNEEIDVMQREIRELETALRNLELTNDKIERYKDYQSKLNKMAEWNKILRSCVQTLFADEIKVLRSQIEL
ncbi:hypothetical protein M3Y98_00277200 [Aphelenchoides besseyi]|nr:hypothetical protein M3Y98_00277200 [Aphelenchoides besseyi]